MTVALITIHGMGTTLEGYAAPLRAKLEAALGDAFASIDIASVYYQHFLQGNQQLVWDRINQQTKVHYDDLRKFILFGFGDAAGLETGKAADRSVYELSQLDIARKLFTACQRHGPQVPVVFVAQSLGCQVLSNYFYDAQKAAAGGIVSAGIWKDIARHGQALAGRALSAAEIGFVGGNTCMSWVTTGCNIPVFVAAHKQMTILPIDKPTPAFKWLNLYDPDDVLGWPLQPLSFEYAQLVEDRQINAGQGMMNWILKSWNPMSHTIYWTDDDVVTPLAAILRQLLH